MAVLMAVVVTKAKTNFLALFCGSRIVSLLQRSLSTVRKKQFAAVAIDAGYNELLITTCRLINKLAYRFHERSRNSLPRPLKFNNIFNMVISVQTSRTGECNDFHRH